MPVVPRHLGEEEEENISALPPPTDHPVVVADVEEGESGGGGGGGNNNNHHHHHSHSPGRLLHPSVSPRRGHNYLGGAAASASAASAAAGSAESDDHHKRHPGTAYRRLSDSLHRRQFSKGTVQGLLALGAIAVVVIVACSVVIAVREVGRRNKGDDIAVQEADVPPRTYPQYHDDVIVDNGDAGHQPGKGGPSSMDQGESSGRKPKKPAPSSSYIAAGGNNNNTAIGSEIPVGKPPGHGQRGQQQGTRASLHVAGKNRKREGCYLIKLHRGAGKGNVREVRRTIAKGVEERAAKKKNNKKRAKKPSSMNNSGNFEQHEYTSVLEGFSMCGMDEEMVQQTLQHPLVDFVEEDARMSAATTTTTTTPSSPPWGLDRIDQDHLPMDNIYDTDGIHGDGVDVYVVDTGIRSSHSEFGGRVAGGMSVVTGSTDTWEDCDGHGTHVAGIIGGKTVGVAPGISLFAVRVLDCMGNGFASGVIAGLDWIGSNLRPGRRSVVNLSLGGGLSSALDNSVRSLIAAGVTVVAAAGNDGQDACNYSPTRVTEAITVGASTETDEMASWSNRGSCINIFAPGVNVESAWISSDTDLFSLSGSSTAAAHAAGAVALYLQVHPEATPATVSADLLAGATANVLSRIPTTSGDTPNRLLYVRPLIQAPSSSDPTQPTLPTPSTTTPSATSPSSPSTTPPTSSAPSTCDGTLCENGQVADWASTFHPASSNGYYCSVATGPTVHRAILKPSPETDASTSDLDLYLWKWDVAGGRWVVKDASTAFGSREEVRFTASGGGCWSWEVYSYFGSGTYTIDMTIPA